MTAQLLRALMGAVVLTACVPGIAAAQAEAAQPAPQYTPAAGAPDAPTAAALKAVHQRFVRAFSARSGGRMTPLFSGDARLYSNGRTLSPAEFAETVLALEVRSASWTTGSVAYVSPGRMRQEGRYSIQAPRQFYTGDYTILWQHQSGADWRIAELRMMER
jgi:hypothetical protein